MGSYQALGSDVKDGLRNRAEVTKPGKRCDVSWLAQR